MRGDIYEGRGNEAKLELRGHGRNDQKVDFCSTKKKISLRLVRLCRGDGGVCVSTKPGSALPLNACFRRPLLDYLF